MSDTPEDPTAVGLSTEEPAIHPVNQGKSIIDLLKQDAEEIAQPKDAYIPIKGWERTGLAARYRMPENGKELDLIGQRIERQFKTPYDRNLYIGIDTMIRLNTGLYVRSEEAITDDNLKGWVELDPEGKGIALTFSDGDIARILGWSDVEAGRDLVKRFFANNEIAINDHAARLNRWLIDSKIDVNVALWRDTGE